MLMKTVLNDRLVGIVNDFSENVSLLRRLGNMHLREISLQNLFQFPTVIREIDLRPLIRSSRIPASATTADCQIMNM